MKNHSEESPPWWRDTLFWHLSLCVSMEMKSSPRTTPLSATFVRLLGLSLKIGSTVQSWNYWESSYQFCFSACKDKGIIFTHILISSWDTTDGYTFTRQQHSFTIKKNRQSWHQNIQDSVGTSLRSIQIYAADMLCPEIDNSCNISQDTWETAVPLPRSLWSLP